MRRKKKSQWCPIGSLNLHTMNAERDECIWCGPNGLAWKPGQWVTITDGSATYRAWTTNMEFKAREND